MNWETKLLEEVVEYFIDYRGKTPNKTTSGIPLVTAKIVKNGALLEPDEFISEEDYPLWMTRGFPEINDVVLTTEAPLGEVALIKDRNVALAQRIITLRGFKDKLDNKFLKYWFQSEYGQYELDSRASGTTVFGIKASVLKKIPVPVPSLPEQQAIASVLSALDDKIDLLQRQNQTLEQMAATLFWQWFIESDGDNEITIDELIDFNPKRSLSKNTQAMYLEMAGLSTHSFNATGYYERVYSSGTKFKNQDTLLARITPCLENGKACYVHFLQEDEIAWGSTEYIVMRPKDKLHPFFAYVLSKDDSFREYAESCMEGSSGRQRVNINHLVNFTVVLPNESVIQKFNDFLETIEQKLIYNAKQIPILESLRDTLLPKLISGEVRLKGFETLLQA